MEFHSLKVNQWTGSLKTHEENLLKIKTKQTTATTKTLSHENSSHQLVQHFFSFQVHTRIHEKPQPAVNERRKDKLEKLKKRERLAENPAKPMGSTQKERLQLAGKVLAWHPVSCNKECMNLHRKQNQIMRKILISIFHLPVMFSQFNCIHNHSPKCWLRILEVQTQGSGEMRSALYNSVQQNAS